MTRAQYRDPWSWSTDARPVMRTRAEAPAPVIETPAPAIPSPRMTRNLPVDALVHWVAPALCAEYLITTDCDGTRHSRRMLCDGWSPSIADEITCHDTSHRGRETWSRIVAYDAV